MKKAEITEIRSDAIYLNIGNNRSVPVRGIVGIFDMDSATVSRVTRDYLRGCEKKSITISVANSLPKSIVYYDDGISEHIYFSSFTSAVLRARAEKNEQRKM